MFQCIGSCLSDWYDLYVISPTNKRGLVKSEKVVRWGKLKTSEIKWLAITFARTRAFSIRRVGFSVSSRIFPSCQRALCAHNSMLFLCLSASLHYDFMLFSRQSTLLPPSRCCHPLSPPGPLFQPILGVGNGQSTVGYRWMAYWADNARAKNANCEWRNEVNEVNGRRMMEWMNEWVIVAVSREQ